MARSVLPPLVRLALLSLAVVSASGFVVRSSETRSLEAVPKPTAAIGRNQPAATSLAQLSPPLRRRPPVASLSVSSKASAPADEEPSFVVNPYFGATWLALVAWAFTIAPGSLGSPEDSAMLQAVIAEPVHPGLNELYYTCFNLFAVIPVVLAALALPQAQPGRGLPAAPFLLASAGIGYFGLGPYLTLRAPPRDSLVDGPPPGWLTRNVLENKAFSWAVVAFTLYLPVVAGVVPAWQADPATLWAGFLDLVTGSRFAAVSLADLTILYVCGVALTPRDYLLRRPDATEAEARNVALATALLPILGSALYCALRPALPVGSDEE